MLRSKQVDCNQMRDFLKKTKTSFVFPPVEGSRTGFIVKVQEEMDR